jgi:uncharacterized protein (DUF736 family)
MSNRKIGALWVRTTQEGKKYMSGVLNDLRGDISIAVFKNDRKEKENQPDYNIIISEKDKKPETKYQEASEQPEIQPEDLPF